MAPTAVQVKKNHMPAASHRVLQDLFENHLHFTPTVSDIAQFETDLAVVSPSLMKDSLIELSVGRSQVPIGRGAWRTAIYAVYNRKVAEHAQLFPAFHCFETAFRSTVAVTLEEHYRIPRWWGPSTTEHRGGAIASTIGVVQSVPRLRLRAILLLVTDLTEKSRLDVTAFQDGYQLLGHSTLGQIRRLVDTHWTLFKDRFVVRGQPMAPTAFHIKFDRVEKGRNAVYHHRSLEGMADVYEAARELLECIGFDLPTVHGKIAATKCKAPPYFP